MRILILLFTTCFITSHLFAGEKVGEIMTKKGELISVYNSLSIGSDFSFCRYQKEDGKFTATDISKIKWLIVNDTVFCFLPRSQKWKTTEFMRVLAVSDKNVLACSYDYQHYIISMSGDVLEEALSLRRPEPVQKMLSYFPDCPQLKEKVETNFKKKLFPEFYLNFEQCNTTMDKHALIEHFEQLIANRKK